MKWEDTIIDLKDVSNESLRIQMEKILKQQAQITWDAVVREMVEWLKGIFCPGEGIYVIYPEDWQAKLKEWGYKEVKETQIEEGHRHYGLPADASQRRM